MLQPLCRPDGLDERAFLLRREARNWRPTSRQIPDNVRRIAEAHRRYRKRFESLDGQDIRIALDEWNYWYGPRASVRSARRYLSQGCPGDRRRAERVFPAKRHRLHGQLRPDGQRDRLHQDQQDRGRVGDHGAGVEALPPPFRHAARRGHAAAPLDVAAAWTDDRKTLTLAIVNPSCESGIGPVGDARRQIPRHGQADGRSPAPTRWPTTTRTSRRRWSSRKRLSSDSRGGCDWPRAASRSMPSAENSRSATAPRPPATAGPRRASRSRSIRPWRESNLAWRPTRRRG